MTMTYDPSRFVKLFQKILVGNYEPIMGKLFAGKHLYNLHDLQLLFMLWIKDKFSECPTPLHKYEDPNGRLSGDGFAQARQHGAAFGGSYPQIFFVPPKFCCAQKNLFQIYDKN